MTAETDSRTESGKAYGTISHASSKVYARGAPPSGHPVGARFLVPLGGHLLGLRPEFDRPAAGDIPDTELRVIPAAERKRLARDRDTHVHSDHSGAGALHHVARCPPALREHG